MRAGGHASIHVWAYALPSPPFPPAISPPLSAALASNRNRIKANGSPYQEEVSILTALHSHNAPTHSICPQQHTHWMKRRVTSQLFPPPPRLLAPTVVQTSIVGRDRPRTGLSPVLPRRGRSPRRPSPTDQSSLLTEAEASRQSQGAVRGHQLVGRTQSESVQGTTANQPQDVFGATPFATENLPANQLQQRPHDDDFDPRAPPTPPPESKENPQREEIPQNFPPPPPGFADQEFDDFFIASEDPGVAMTTAEHQSRPHPPPQTSEGFGDSFADQPVSAFAREVMNDVIPAVDQGNPPVCSPDPFGAPRFVPRPPATSRPRPPSQSENENESTPAPNTSQPHSRHQRTDSFGLAPFVEQGLEVKGQTPHLSSEVKGQSSEPSATNKPEPIYATVTKKAVKQEDPFGLSPFTAEERQPPSPTQAPVASQRLPQPGPPQSPPAPTRAAPPSHLDHSLDLFEPGPVRPAATKQSPRRDQQGLQYHSSSPWQQGADCFGAIPFVSVAAKDN